LKTALIVGSTGQDGTYLLGHLEGLGYEVVGFNRGTVHGNYRGDAPNIECLESVMEVVGRLRPTEIYYLAAYHHSSEGGPDEPAELVYRTIAINTLALSNFLLAILKQAPESRLFYAASSHVFGQPDIPLQNEQTPLNPTSVYGISKAAAVQLCRHFRQEYNVYASCGILYNHESHLRSPQFLSRKVVRAAVQIHRGCREKLRVANLDAAVDWGFAPDYAVAMWHILQLPNADDFVVATGTLHTVRDFVQTAFQALDLNWEDHVVVEAPLGAKKPAHVPLCGDSSRLRSLTGWRPRTSFREMVVRMIAEETVQCPTSGRSQF
jgi:GDPmannose 4,6-dehydratase